MNVKPAKTKAEPAIEVNGLAKRFGDVRAVDNVSFTVATGRITGLLGGNGAGKTTTLAMILGLIEPSDGSITILGHDLARERSRIAARMNFESPYVDMPLRLSVRQNLEIYGRLYGINPPAGRIAVLAEQLDLGTFLDRETGKLSAGQKTRVGLAKALLNEPDVVLLDEPTASLDPDTAHWVRGVLRDYCADNQATILLASHNMNEVEQICHQVLIMKDGRIVDHGAPEQLIRRHGRKTMEEVFLDIVRGTGKLGTPAS